MNARGKDEGLIDTQEERGEKASHGFLVVSAAVDRCLPGAGLLGRRLSGESCMEDTLPFPLFYFKVFEPRMKFNLLFFPCIKA